MLFQYLSDLHLEFYPNPKNIDKINIKPIAPYLVIAGDIACVVDNINNRFERFIYRMSKLFKYVFIVSGNHEYYKCEAKVLPMKEWFELIDNTIISVTMNTKNVIFLQNKTFLIPDTDIAVFGCTLWTEILEREKEMVTDTLADYVHIPNFTVDDSINMHRISVKALESELSKHHDKRFVVITHHLPSYKLIASRYVDSGYNSAFASDVPLADNPQIVAWFAGHTHLQIENGKFHINPIGYFADIKGRYIEYNKIIEV